MLIWLLTLLLLAIFGAAGYFKGAIRMTIPLLGLFLGAMLAVPLAPLMKPVVRWVGLENPVWSILLPPLLVFLLINILFVVVGFFGHAKINLFYVNRTDDVQRLSWVRLNQRLGVCVGLVAGAIYTVLIAWVIYVVGYLTVQLSPGDSEASMAKYLNQARADIRASGMERIVAAIDGTPEWYYQASDILGLLYHNPALDSRLAAYPAFIALAERQEFTEIAADTDFQNLLASQPSVGQVVESPRVQAVLGNEELMNQLRALDLKDLNHYLRTGESDRYQDTPILGRWEIDSYLTFLMEKRRKREMTAADVKLLRYRMEYVKGFKLFVAPDNTVRLKGPDISQVIGRLTELAKAVSEGTRAPRAAVRVATPTAQPQVAPAQPMDAATLQQQQRYGIRPPAAASSGFNRGVPTAPAGGGQPIAQPQQQLVLVQPAQTAPVAPAMTAPELAAEIARLPMVTLAEGTWREEGGTYTASLNPTQEMKEFVGTRRSSTELSVREDRLYLSDQGQTMVMSRF